MRNRKSPRILIVFGTRPELIKLAPVIKQFHQKELSSEILVVNAAQQEDLVNDQLEFWKIKPDITFKRKTYNTSMVRLQAETMNQLQDVLDRYRSLEYIIVQGDTNTTWAGANFAFLNKLKIVHVEAGLRTNDLETPFPEEFNRICVSKVAYHHFTPSSITYQNLIEEDIDKKKISVCGNTVVDALVQSGIEIDSTNRFQLNEVLITMHRRENAYYFSHLFNIVEDLSQHNPSLTFRWITHPNYKPELLNRLKKISANIIIEGQLPYPEFIRLYSKSAFIITDSGGVTEEASQLGIPVIVFREKTERTEPSNSNYPMIVSLDKHKIKQFFNTYFHHQKKSNNYFGNGNTSEIIVDWFKKELNYIDVDTAIIGGGPAGTGTILKSMKDGSFEDYINGGIAIIEKSSELISGSLSKYQVNSDTLSNVFLECLEGFTAEYLDLKKMEEEINFVKDFSGQSIPLNKLQPFFSKLSLILTEALMKNDLCKLFMNTAAIYIKKESNESYHITLSNSKKIICRNIVMATGGNPHKPISKISMNNSDIDISVYSGKNVSSDMIIKGCFDEQLKKLKEKDLNIVILGGSHSAFSVAHYLLNTIRLGKGSIKIWANTKPKIFYNTTKEALADGYSDFTNDDVCPVTNRLYRLAGLRMDGKNLYRKILGLEKDIEKRVCLHLLEEDHKILKYDLEKADVIIHAIGYEFNPTPFFNENDEPVKFAGSETGNWVNDHCEMIDGRGNRLENIFAMGLASGFIPKGKLGGEPSFKGQTNGIWYYQNLIAEIILREILHKKTVNMQGLELAPPIR